MKYFIYIIVFLFITSSLAGANEGARTNNSVCIECHASDIMEPRLKEIVTRWEKSWHYQNNVSCHDCHGGDPGDEAAAMSSERGFKGVPASAEVPSFCGKCHLGVLNNYLESRHGKELKTSGNAPNCVTCHGSHDIRKADINIISKQLCSKCHSYEKAAIIKQALFSIENKIKGINEEIVYLKTKGFLMEDQEKNLFRIQAEFRFFFHTTDVPLLKEKFSKFDEDIETVRRKTADSLKEIEFRKDYAAFLMLIFICTGIVLFFLSKTYRD